MYTSAVQVDLSLQIPFLLAFMGVESLERTGKGVVWYHRKEIGCEGPSRTENGQYLSARTNPRTMQRSRLGYSIDAILGLTDQTLRSEDVRHQREPDGNESTPEMASTPEVRDRETKTRSEEDVEQLSPKTINREEYNGKTFPCLSPSQLYNYR